MTATAAPVISRVPPRTFYRIVAIAEAVTWTLLIAGMLLKYVADAGGLPVLIGGSLHGFVFITYALTAVLVGVNQRWSVKQIVAAVATAIVPYATIPFDRRLDRRGLLDGDWRHTATDDPARPHLGEPAAALDAEPPGDPRHPVRGRHRGDHGDAAGHRAARRREVGARVSIRRPRKLGRLLNPLTRFR